MANRFPLTLISTTVSELPSGDALDLTGSNVYNNGAVITLPTTTGTLATLANSETLTNKTLTNPVINNIKLGIDQIATAASTTTLTVSSNHQQRFTGSTTQTVVLPVTSTLAAGMTYAIENSSTGNITVNSSGGNLVATVIPGTTMDFTCIGTSLTTAADWDAEVRAFATITGTGACVLGTSPTLTTPNIGAATGTSLSVSGSLTSTVATGTAPLVVSSTTKVTNLNVEQVDGYHADEANTASSLVARNASKQITTSGVILSGSTSGTSTLVASAAAGTTTHTLPAVTGTIITTGDTGTVTSTMIADGTIVNADISASAAIAVSKLAASTISGVTLGNNLNTLTIGTGLSGTSYNGSAAVTITNTGVTSNVAGTGVSVSGATGAVTISIGQAVATSSNVQFNSVGVGTAGSGTAGEIRATNAITAYYSDDRLKTRTGNIENALEKVLSLDGFHYHANDTAVALGYDASKQEVGLSAQQVQAVLPEVVVPAPIDDKYLTIHYDRLVPLLIEAIKEQQKQIEDLKSKIQG